MKNDTEGSEVDGEESQEPVRKSDEELDAMEAFKICHTNCTKGTSDAAREAVVIPLMVPCSSMIRLILLTFTITVL